MRCAIWLTLLAVAARASAEVAPLSVERLRVPGRVLAVHAEDVNGDGKRDLVVIVGAGLPPQMARRIAVFFAHGSRYSADPDQLLPAPASAAFVDLGDVDGDGKRAIVFADASGLGMFHLGGDGRFEAAPRRLVDVRGLLALPDDEELPFFDVMRDWNGDGKDEIVLPLADRTAVFTRGSDGSWTRAVLLNLPPRASYAVRPELYEPRLRNFAVRATLTVPELSTADCDGDGKPDLVAVVDEILQVHAGGRGGAIFSPTAVARLLLGNRSAVEAQRGSAHLQTVVRDLDGDGVADLAVNKISGGLGQMHAETAFHYGRRGGGFGAPVQIIKRDGYAGALAFADLDGDGKPDLVSPHADVGLGAMARVLLSKRMSVGFEARRNLGRGFSVTPDAVRDIDFSVDYSVVADLEGGYPSVQGDFNGDGKADFIGQYDKDGYGVWLGGGKALLAEEPKAVVHAPPSRYFFAADLDGDGRADAVVFYRWREGMSGTILVLRNSGQGW
ncbi:MAG: FG-GAP repeat domain-containing protein [Polyangia bacterium]